MILRFPQNFLWGSAVSAYQTEGGVVNSDWSAAYDAGRACDYYNRYAHDLDIARKLNQNAFRFSIEWSRIEPKEGYFDAKEIAHYRGLLENLRERGIASFVTLYHFTQPMWLAKKGGWTNSKTTFYFTRFAQTLLKEYGSLVDFWITINEPLVWALHAYLTGLWPPAKRNPLLFLMAINNQISAHNRIYELFHGLQPDIKIGLSHNLASYESFNSKSFLDSAGARFYRFFGNEYFLNKTRKNVDFIGLNYYFHWRVRALFLKKSATEPVSDVGWRIYPKGIYCVLKELLRYNLPVYVTENGLADAKDVMRQDFIKQHLYWIAKAIEEGVDIRGYLHWSLMDNFEWDKGFVPRFGLVEIDYQTLERKIRPSAFYYAKICKNNFIEI